MTWNALPHTEYCVDINKTTLDSSALNSECGIADRYIFMYSNHSVCDRFSFTVTPTEGERRGTTSEPDTGFFTRTEGVYGALHSHSQHIHVFIVKYTYKPISEVLCGLFLLLQLLPLHNHLLTLRNLQLHCP